MTIEETVFQVEKKNIIRLSESDRIMWLRLKIQTTVSRDFFSTRYTLSYLTIFYQTR